MATRRYLCFITLYYRVRFEVFTAVTMKNGVFWDVTPCGSCKNWRFGGTQHLHHQGDKNRWTKNNVSLTSNRRTRLTFLVRRFLLPGWRRWVPLKRQFLQEPHGVTSQKTPFFIIAFTRALSDLYSGPHYSSSCLHALFLKASFNKLLPSAAAAKIRIRASFFPA
jgi:hypothetical protein